MNLMETQTPTSTSTTGAAEFNDMAWSNHVLTQVSPFDTDVECDCPHAPTRATTHENDDNSPQEETCDGDNEATDTEDEDEEKESLSPEENNKRQEQLNQLDQQLSKTFYVFLVLLFLWFMGVAYVASSQGNEPLQYGHCRIGSYTFIPEQCRQMIDDYRLLH